MESIAFDSSSQSGHGSHGSDALIARESGLEKLPQGPCHAVLLSRLHQRRVEATARLAHKGLAKETTKQQDGFRQTTDREDRRRESQSSAASKLRPMALTARACRARACREKRIRAKPTALVPRPLLGAAFIASSQSFSMAGFVPPQVKPAGKSTLAT